MTKDCPCGSGSAYADCCGPLLARARRAQTAEALMRSRYTAYVQSDAAYLEETLMPRKRSSFDADALLTWNADVTWKGLRILATDRGGPGEDDGVVEFIATYAKDGEESEVREISRFRKKGGSWFYVDGRLEGEAVPESAAAPKAGRNEPCPCGSGKKFKRCCG